MDTEETTPLSATTGTGMKPSKPPPPAKDENALLLGEEGARRLASYTMRVKSGASYRDIARAHGVSVKKAWTDVQAVMELYRRGSLREHCRRRQMQAERLDVALFAVMPAVKRGDLKAIRAMTLLEKRRAELLGLDAPKRFEHTGENGGPIETINSTTIREQWTPQEAAQRAGSYCGAWRSSTGRTSELEPTAFGRPRQRGTEKMTAETTLNHEDVKKAITGYIKNAFPGMKIKDMRFSVTDD